LKGRKGRERGVQGEEGGFDEQGEPVLTLTGEG